jgi:hypothetical protein
MNQPCIECGRTDLPLHIDHRCPECHPLPGDGPETLDCGHVPTPTDHLGTGTAYDADDNSMCYDCAYRSIMDDIVMAGISLRNDQADFKLPTVYMSSDGKTITTWDGRFVGRVTYHGEVHPWATRYKNTLQSRHTIDVRITYGADVVNAYGIGAAGSPTR